MNRVRIDPLNVRDLTYILANLREPDAREVLCQAPAGIDRTTLGIAMFQSLPRDWAWCASFDGQPACAFGFQPFNVAVSIGWCFGTRHMVRTIPAVSRHCLAREPDLLALGVRRVEVRSLVGHDIAHAWLTRLGCRRETLLPEFGRDGETFTLWAWTLRALPSQTKDYRHVPSEGESTAAAHASADTG